MTDGDAGVQFRERPAFVSERVRIGDSTFPVGEGE